MATVTAADPATTAAAAAGITSGHPTAAATTGSGVGSHRDVIERKNAGVENPAAHGACRRRATVTAIAGHQPLGDHQSVQRHGGAGSDFHHAGLVLPVEGHVGHAVVVQIAIDGDVLVDQ